MNKIFKHLFFIVCLFGIFGACSNDRNRVVQTTRTIKTQENMMEANRVLIRKDKQRILGAIKRNNWNMTESETGLWYEIIEEGKGVKAEDGLIISFDYKLSLLDGTICYDSEKLGVKSFKIGRGGVEAGLEQGVLLLSEGTKARFIIPPYMAHGLPGDGNMIPARSIIVYELNVRNISKE